MHRTAFISALSFLLFPSTARADIRLPAMFADNMVMQRDADTSVWGWAEPGEVVTVRGSWGGDAVSARTGEDRRWSVKLQTPGAGGPHRITVEGANLITIDNVLCGEVWVCSGQSNMWWRVSMCDDAVDEIAAADHPQIRLFEVAQATAMEPQDDCAGVWTVCSPDTVGDYTAAGYYFGRMLHEELGVPIGLISTNWGGTVAEAWTSAGTLAAQFPEFQGELDQITRIREGGLSGDLAARQLSWWRTMDEKGTGLAARWMEASHDDSGWGATEVPGRWEAVGLGSFDGCVWYRRSVEIPVPWIGRSLTLELGPIDDMDRAWVNGALVGETTADGKWMDARHYPVPAGCIESAQVQITVCVVDTGGVGSLGSKPEQMRLRLTGDEAEAPVSLSGPWRFQCGVSLADVGAFPRNSAFGQNSPTALYNGMIAPLVPYAIRGAIWYQGESNRSRPEQYRELFPAMIRNWRDSWGQGDFPFGFVQIAPFGYEGDTGEAAALREAQTMALASPRTGMAVTMDIGNPRNIHPTNKQEVGRRLGLWALATVYGQVERVYSGPMYASHAVLGESIRISFDHAHGGLLADGGAPSHFTIAGEDHVFHPATATIRGGAIVVHGDQVRNPVAVRHAWGAADEPNLKNAEGLPAPSFRTDDW